MLRRNLVLGFIIAAVVTLSGCRIEFSTPEKDLMVVVNANISGMNAKDIAQAMDSVHAESPFYEQMHVMLEEINKIYDLTTELISFEYLGSNEEYAIAIVKQKTSKDDGPKFKDNVVKMMSVFKKQEGVWKVWQSLTLDIEYLEDE